MEVRSPPETVPAPASVENGPTSNLTTIYYTLAMSATPGIHRFSTHWAPNSPPKVNTERISEKVIEKVMPKGAQKPPQITPKWCLGRLQEPSSSLPEQFLQKWNFHKTQLYVYGLHMGLPPGLPFLQPAAPNSSQNACIECLQKGSPKK